VLAGRRELEDSEDEVSDPTPSRLPMVGRVERLAVVPAPHPPLDDPRFAIWADRLTTPLDSAVAVIGHDATFSYVSPTVRAVLGYEPHALTGTTYLDLVHPDDLSAVQRSVTAFSRSTTAAPATTGTALAPCRVRHRNGSWLPVELTGAAHADDGTIDGIVVAVRPTATAVTAEPVSLLGDAADMLCLTDLRGRVLYVNRACERILGVPPEQLIGRPLTDLLHPDDLARSRATFSRIRAAGGHDVAEARVRHADGGWRWVETSTRLSSSGDIVGAVFVMRDISERIVERERDDHAQALEQLALQISQQVLRQNVHAGMAELNFFAGEVARLFDVELVFIEELEGSVMFSRGAYVPPGSNTKIHSSFDVREFPLLAKQLERREPFFYDDGLRQSGMWDGLTRDPDDNRSGALLPLVTNGRLIGGLSLASSRARTWTVSERTSLQLICDTVAAMFERRRLEDARQHIEARFRTLADHAADIVTLCSADGILLYVSPASARLLGTPPEELVGRRARTLFHPDDVAVLDAAISRLIDGEDVVLELRLGRADGTWAWVALSARKVDTDRGELEFWGSVRDIGDRRNLELELLHRASHDPLTDLPNRSVFTNAMIELTRTASLPASLVMIDLDDFKAVNDTYGHPAGDLVLIETAERLRGLVRTTDVMARMGGDEFLVLCPHTGPRDAAALVERLGTELPRPIRLDDGTLVAVGCSIGVATADDVDGLERLLHTADAEMYRSKASRKVRSMRDRQLTPTTASSSAR
jgi:diguanylate cyclase (GGDEF)-like protein/PAS domain S-box-containing protein